MDTKEIVIQSFNLKKGKPEKRTFTCQLITIGNTRTYVLDNTKRDLQRTNFKIAPGCKVFDDGVVYRVDSISYWPRPKYVFITVSRDPYPEVDYEDDDSYDGYGTFF